MSLKPGSTRWYQRVRGRWPEPASEGQGGISCGSFGLSRSKRCSWGNHLRLAAKPPQTQSTLVHYFRRLLWDRKHVHRSKESTLSMETAIISSSFQISTVVDLLLLLLYGHNHRCMGGKCHVSLYLKAMTWSHQLNIYSLDLQLEATTLQWGSLAFGQQHTLKFKLRLSSSFCRDFHPYQMNYRPLWKRSSFLKIFSCDSTFRFDYSKTAHGWGKWEKVKKGLSHKTGLESVYSCPELQK